MQNDRSKTLIDSITDSINTLATMTDATAKSDLFKTWLRAVSRFHHYSFNNQLLVLLQRPQAERVAGFHTWKSLGRNVKKGAKGIAILAPCVRKKTAEEADKMRKGERVSEMRLCGFRVTHVFDIADTEGKPLPELDHRAQAGGESLLPRLESAAAAMGIVLEYREETGSPNGWSEGGKVVVNATLSSLLLGALGDRKSGIVFGVRRGRRRNSTGHSAIRISLTWRYSPDRGSSMYSTCRISASGFSAPRVLSKNATASAYVAKAK